MCTASGLLVRAGNAGSRGLDGLYNHSRLHSALDYLSPTKFEQRWWAAQRKTGNYDTLSVTIPPGCSTFAFWVAQQLLAGKKLPHEIQMPLLEVQADQLDSVLAKTPQGGLANKLYTRDEVLKVVDAK